MSPRTKCSALQVPLTSCGSVNRSVLMFRNMHLTHTYVTLITNTMPTPMCSVNVLKSTPCNNQNTHLHSGLTNLFQFTSQTKILVTGYFSTVEIILPVSTPFVQLQPIALHQPHYHNVPHIIAAYIVKKRPFICNNGATN